MPRVESPLPFFVSGFRVAVLPLILASLYWHSPLAPSVAAGLFMLAWISDWFDGQVARWTKTTSRLGHLADLLADRILVLVLLVFIIQLQASQRPLLFATMVILAREIAQSALVGVAASRQKSFSANQFDRLREITLNVAILGLLWRQPLEWIGNTWDFGIGALVLASVFTMASFGADLRAFTTLMVDRTIA